MARPRGKLDFKNEAAQVASLFKVEKTLWKKERLQTIKLLLETELSYKDVAEVVGRHPSRVKAWAKLFKEGGLSSLLVRDHGGGRKSLLTKEAEDQLVEKLRKGTFRTARQIEAWLEKEHGIRYGNSSIYYVLGKLGGRLKVPRPSHTKKDEVKVLEFKETLAQKMVNLDLPKGRPVRLWVYDEMRYGLHPLLRKMWSLVGTRVVAPVNRRFKWGYLFGALEVETGRSEFLYTDGVVKDFDRAFLEQIGENDPNAMHVVIGDGAGFHHREAVEQDNALPEKSCTA